MPEQRTRANSPLRGGCDSTVPAHWRWPTLDTCRMTGACQPTAPAARRSQANRKACPADELLPLSTLHSKLHGSRCTGLLLSVHDPAMGGVSAASAEGVQGESTIKITQPNSTCRPAVWKSPCPAFEASPRLLAAGWEGGCPEALSPLPSSSGDARLGAAPPVAALAARVV